MKLFCDQKELDFAVNVVNKAISPNNTLPVLNNILLKAEGKKLFFSATNLEIAITCSINADVRGEGSITIPAKLLTSYIALLSGEQVEINLIDGFNISLKCGSSQTKIKGIDPDEFPLIPKVEKGQEIVVGNETLTKAINETVFASSSNTSRPVLSGLLITIADKDDKLKFVATDSYRLAEKVVKIEKASEEEMSFIVPARTMSELAKILGRSQDKEVKINVTKNQVLFKVDGIELISRLVEGKYPDYEKIIPAEQKTKVEVSVEDLSLVLKRVSLFARENNNSVKMAVTNDGKMMVSSEETRVGEEKAEIDVKISGENNKISLNSQYLLDVLTHIGEDKITLVINDKASPAVIRLTGEKGDSYVYIIMPLKI